MAINLRKLHPMQIVERALFAQSLKEIGVEKLVQLDKVHHVFLVTYVDDAGNPTEQEIDWEFVLFEATSYQMNQLLNCFIPKPKESNLILPPSSEGEAPIKLQY